MCQMGRDRKKTWALKWCSFFASVAIISVASGEDTKCAPTADTDTGSKPPNQQQYDTDSNKKTKPTVEEVFKKACPSSSESNNRFLMLVSTLDGKVSALNLEKEGQIEWTINTGAGDMLSSSISKLEVNRNGRKTHLIPSLEGGLYQYDGNSVEPVPFNADTLLSSSFRLNDNSIVVGGKETEIYGIDVKTGRVKYICDMEGCKLIDNTEKKVQDSSETLVVSRKTKTVRAVEMSTGAEKWNFSVGQHEMEYITAGKSDTQSEPALTDNSQYDYYEYHDDDADDVNIGACFEEFVEEDSLFNFPWWSEHSQMDPNDIDLKVIVPRGLVIAVSKSNPDMVYWQHKFETPIANAWTLKDGKMTEMDLFDAKIIPALAMDPDFNTAGPDRGEEENIPDMPALYIGSHEKQLYVQASVHMIHAVEDSINQAVVRGDVYPVSMPSVTWKPYIATAMSRTPAEINHPLQITWVDGVPYDDKSLAIWKEYPYDVGYYLFPDYTPMKLNPSRGANVSDNRNNDDFYFDIPMVYRWKELVALTMFLTVLLNVCIMKVIKPKAKIIVKSSTSSDINLESSGQKGNDVSVKEEGDKTQDTTSEDKKGDFQSRYYTDFEQISCLGKGGFGVVFHTRNKLDDCDYAVKRITLHNSEKAREKVIREVKALAKLDHSGIVRFHQAWLETPPQGWQEEKDRTELADLSFSPTPGYIVTEYTPSPKNSKDEKRGGKRNKQKLSSKSPPKHHSSQPVFNPLRPFGDPSIDDSVISLQKSDDESDDSFIIYAENSNNSQQLKRNGSTEPFTPHTQFNFEGGEDDYEDTNGSFNFGIGSYGTKFVESDSDDDSDNNSCNMSFLPEQRTLQCRNRNFSTPFKKYSTNSGIESSTSQNPQTFTSPIVTSFSKTRPPLDDNSFDIVFEDSGCSEKFFEDSPHDHGHAVIDINSSDNLHSVSKLSGSPSSQPIFPDQNFTSPERPNCLKLKDENNKSICNRNNSQPQPKLYLYIQMRLCKKENLKEWLASNTLNRDRKQCLDIFDQIISAVEYVHDSGLMHRDLKPSNIFFSMDGTVKIGDFGLVTALEECGDVSGTMGIVRTPASVYYNKHTDQVGTKLYMSPEQIDGRNYTHKVDIYALGLIFFELCYPFATQMERVRTLLEVKRLLFPARFQRELPEEGKLVSELLSPYPDKRPSAKEILNHSLLKDFQPFRHQNRMRSTSRSRTFSQSSNSSNPSSTTLMVPSKMVE